MIFFQKCVELVSRDFQSSVSIIIFSIILINNTNSVNSCILRKKTISKTIICSLLTGKWMNYDFLAVARPWHTYPFNLVGHLIPTRSSKRFVQWVNEIDKDFPGVVLPPMIKRQSSSSRNVCNNTRQRDRQKLMMSNALRLKWNQGHTDKTLQR